MKQLLSICASFRRLFKDDLAQRVEAGSAGHCRTLLTFLLRNPRDLGGPKTYHIDIDRENIIRGSNLAFGHSSNLIPIFAKSSILHFRAVADSFERVKITLSDLQKNVRHTV
ncbi:hypothetical protein RF11_04047 [Thelohanellus kitauei]|uniref:Uncharacterized protein n=1 Tax=Thelohanellus kitauei TaxID=669202 RepID=A0A0C2MVW1_THEKT|nr:hypothetical protein RF11_04047 [Thelohanellus kitauei]